jgi:type IV secretory pathway TraG/TraD family ATPase VirD4
MNGMEHVESDNGKNFSAGRKNSVQTRAMDPNADRGIYLGQGEDAPWWAGPQRSTLVLGPPRSGKTSALVVPNVLAAEGPVLATSTKPDVMEATAPWRGRDGWTFLFDPSGEVACPPGVERVGWSPLTTAARWDAAAQTAEAMVRASRLTGAFSSGAGEHHWTERAGSLLAPLLHAAALEGASMRTLLHWIDRHHGGPALDILSSRVGPEAVPTDVLSGIVSTDAREQSGIWSTASGVLAAYRTDGALASTEAPPLDLQEFCRGAHTLYVCSPGRRQQQFAPLVVGLIGDVRDATYRQQLDGMTRPPTLLALDEVANISPVPDLPSMVSEGAGQGLLVMACLQDLSQARVRWGAAANGFLSLFGTTVVLPGIADAATLRDISALAGDHDVATTSLSRSVGRFGRVRPSTSVGVRRLPRLPVDAVAHGTPGHAIVVSPDKTLGSVRLTPAHRDSPWREMTGWGRTLTRGPSGLDRGR